MDDTYSENPAWLHYARTCSDRIHIVPIAVCNTRHVEICDIDIVRCSNYHTIFYRADSVFIGNLKMYDVSCLSGDGLSFGNAVTNVRVARCVFESMMTVLSYATVTWIHVEEIGVKGLIQLIHL